MSNIEIVNEKAAQYFLDKLDKAELSFSNRQGPYIQWMKENEDDSKLRLQEWDLSNGIPTMAASLNDFGEGGIACLAGKPNYGKSTMLANMIMQSLQLNSDLIIADISLDDPMKKRYQQYLACISGFKYQDISCPVNLSKLAIDRLGQAKDLVRSFIREDRLRTYEGLETLYEDNETRSISFRSFSNIYATMKQLRSRYPSKKIVFFIDAWNNLNFEASKGTSELGNVNEHLQQLKMHSEGEGIGVFLNAHLRKTENARPTIEDIKGTSDMGYTAVWASVIRNDFKENPFKDPLMYEENGKAWPMIVLENAKNKSSTWEMPAFYGLKSGQCQIIPLTRQEYVAAYNKYQGKIRNVRRS